MSKKNLFEGADGMRRMMQMFEDDRFEQDEDFMVREIDVPDVKVTADGSGLYNMKPGDKLIVSSISLVVDFDEDDPAYAQMRFDHPKTPLDRDRDIMPYTDRGILKDLKNLISRTPFIKVIEDFDYSEAGLQDEESIHVDVDLKPGITRNELVSILKS